MASGTPPHLPRTRLPTSSPSSARLRRLAPSPVKIPPTPPLVFSPAPAQNIKLVTLGSALPTSLRHRQGSLPSPPFEYHDVDDDDRGPMDGYEFAPLELSMHASLLSSCQEAIDSCRRTRPSTANSDRRPSLPLIYDLRGDFGRLSQSMRGSKGPDVPLDLGLQLCEDEDRLPDERKGEVELDPEDWFRHCVPKPVLVEFRDVFAKSVRLDDNAVSDGEMELLEEDETVRATRDVSLAESFNTFGPKDRRPSTVPAVDEDDSYSFSFSAYHDSESQSGNSSPEPPAYPDASQSRSPIDRSPVAAYDASTPLNPGVAQDVSGTPRVSTDREEEHSIVATANEDGTPTPRSYANQRGSGLQAAMADSSWAGPERTPCVISHSRNPTLEKALPPTPARSPAAFNEPILTKKDDYQHSVSIVEHALKAVDKNMTIQLWVDQEGTREVRSTLKYIRTIRPSVFRDREAQALVVADQWCESPTRPELFQQTGCWEFGMNPRSRDKWHFHHAALEGLPVLRRLTINGDEKLDFLAKGASLQIRDTGVYAVHGNEDKGKVEWKFEYLVTPRVSPTTGEYVRDEKVLVPLALYISPSFANPDRALKTHLLNIFKKTLTPNIVAEKVKTPHTGRPPVKTAIPASTSTSSLSVPQTSHGGQHTLGNTTTGGPIISRTIDAIAKAVRSGGSTPVPDTPGPHKFGSRAATPSRPSSRSRANLETSTSHHTLSNAQADADGKSLVEKQTPLRKGRRRAASLFSKARPFTPPSNIVDLHPLPIANLNLLKAQPSLLGLRQPVSAGIGSMRNSPPLLKTKLPSRPSSLKPVGSPQQVLLPTVNRLRSHTVIQPLSPNILPGNQPHTAGKEKGIEISPLPNHPFATHLSPNPPPKDDEIRDSNYSHSRTPSYRIARAQPPTPPTSNHKRMFSSPSLPPPPPRREREREREREKETKKTVTKTLWPESALERFSLDKGGEVGVYRDIGEGKGVEKDVSGEKREDRPVRPVARRRPSTAEPRLGRT